MQYNDSQLKAINHINGPCLVLAGAGSGKTKVITGRIENLVENFNIKPANILAVTFTNKAATEMQERISRTLGGTKGLTCSTFHSLGLRIIREHFEKIGLTRNFSIYTSAEQQMLIKNAMHNLNKSEEMFDPKLVLWQISKYKSANLNHDQVSVISPLTSVAREVFKEYQRLLKENNAVDFDDLLIETLRIFNNYPDVLKKYQQKFKYILVDEFQDTNITQYKIVKALADKYQNLFVVGDDDQSIYGFRGANYENILLFDRDWNNCKTIILNVNYRSTKTVLEAASAVIENNVNRKAKEVSAFNQKSIPLQYFEGIDEKHEAVLITDKIEESIEGRSYNNFSILMRANYQSRVLEEALRAKDIPYKLVGGMNFYDRKEIKDIIAYMTILHNPSDEVAMLRIINTPKRGIGESTVFKISNYAKGHRRTFFGALKDYKKIKEIQTTMHYNLGKFSQIISDHVQMLKINKISETVQSLIEDVGYYDYLDQSKDKPDKIKAKKDIVREFIRSIEDYEEDKKKPSIKRFLDRIALMQDSDDTAAKDKVIVMTVHSSKGLEFDTVFMCGMEEGIFPHQRAIDEGGIEEERRLCYVAITRAKNTLYISRAGERRKFGQKVESKPSRFLSEIPSDLFISKPTDFKKNRVVTARKKIDDIMAKIKKKYEE